MSKAKNAKKKDKSQKENEALREQLARALADYDNLQKRVVREREDESVRQKIVILTKLLPVFDILENMQTHLKDSGLALALDEINKVLRELNVEVIKPQMGHKFDEAIHEAIDAREGKNEGEVLECSLTGYRVGSYIIRPAKVVVSVKRKENKNE